MVNSDGRSQTIFSEHMHRFIDEMASIKKADRRPNDVVRQELWSELKERLSICQEIGKHVDKFIAHSATSESRGDININDAKVTLGKLQDSHRVICETTGFIALRLFYQHLGGFLAIPQFDQLQYFEKSWASIEVVKRLHTLWDEYRKETEKWANWNYRKKL